MYNKNSNGPRIDPCGTAKLHILDISECVSFMYVTCFLSFRYDLNQSRASNRRSALPWQLIYVRIILHSHQKAKLS